MWCSSAAIYLITNVANMHLCEICSDGILPLKKIILCCKGIKALIYEKYMWSARPGKLGLCAQELKSILFIDKLMYYLYIVIEQLQKAIGACILLQMAFPGLIKFI